MRKLILLLSLSFSVFTSNAQLSLSGHSYTQNFDLIGSGLPTGWAVYTGATNASLGTIATFNTLKGYWDTLASSTGPNSCIGLVLTKGFKNYASGNVGHATDTCAMEDAYTDRALGARQVGDNTSTGVVGFDPGMAFVLRLTNTSGLSAFNLAFKLQSLDITSNRTTTWTVDYGLGSSPTSFTAVAPTSGSTTTGGLTFTNTSIAVNFGTALNNQSGNVWIRIAALASTSGSGNRASSAIDDFNLTWTGAAGVTDISAQPALALTVLGEATSDRINFAYTAEEAGNYGFAIYDLAGRTLHNEIITAQTGDQNITVNGLHLAPGMYFAKMSNGNASNVARIIIQ